MFCMTLDKIAFYFNNVYYTKSKNVVLIAIGDKNVLLLSNNN